MPTAGSDFVTFENGEGRDDNSTDEYHEVNEVLSTVDVKRTVHT